MKLLQSDVSSELLPADWNVNPKTYGLRYQEKAKIYVLLCTISDGTIILNLLVNKSLCVVVRFARIYFVLLLLCHQESASFGNILGETK